MREHLEAYERATGRKHPMLADATPCPPGCGQLWHDYAALHSTRQWRSGAPMPITFGEIEAYQRVQGARFAPWELDAIKRADTAFRARRASEGGGK